MKKQLTLTLSIFVGLLFWVGLLAQTVDINLLEKHVVQLLNKPEVHLTNLYGGLTNTSFLARSKADTFVVRIGKPDPEIFGIDRFCEVASQTSASNIGIAPKILYSNQKNGTLITQFIHGKTLTEKDIASPFLLERIVQIVKKCHTIPFKKEFETATIYDKIRKMVWVSQTYKNSFLSREESEKTLGIIDTIEMYFQRNEKKYDGLCHNDLVPANFIDDGKQLWLIDWEYACWGNILLDLASFCVELNMNEGKMQDVLKQYFGPTWHENYYDFELMCAIYNLRDAFWYDLRSKEIDSIGEFNMIDYALKHFKQFKQIVEKNEFLKEKSED